VADTLDPVAVTAAEPMSDLPWPERRDPLASVGAYLLVRLVAVTVLAWMGAQNSSPASVTDTLSVWDGQWYLGIADDGYDGVDPGLTDAGGQRGEDTSLGFLPGYPLVVAVVAQAPGVSLLGAALLVSAAAGVALAVGVGRLGTRVTGSRRAGLLLVVLFAGAPSALSLSMAYTEALFCALAAWALVGVVERRWLLAGVCTAASGLVRSTSTALILAVVLAALVALREGRDGWRPALAVGLAPLGFAAWLAWVAVRTDNLKGWFALRAEGWGDGLSAARDTGDHLVSVLSGQQVEMMDVISVLTLLGAVILLLLAARLVPWPLMVYAGTTVVIIALLTAFNTSYPRLLAAVAFVLFIPVAVELARVRTRAQIGVLSAVVLGGAWYTGYALVVYPYAI
jgi:hypothetical protein